MDSQDWDSANYTLLMRCDPRQQGQPSGIQFLPLHERTQEGFKTFKFHCKLNMLSFVKQKKILLPQWILSKLNEDCIKITSQCLTHGQCPISGSYHCCDFHYVASVHNGASVHLITHFILATVEFRMQQNGSFISSFRDDFCQLFISRKIVQACILLW